MYHYNSLTDISELRPKIILLQSNTSVGFPMTGPCYVINILIKNDIFSLSFFTNNCHLKIFFRLFVISITYIK